MKRTFAAIAIIMLAGLFTSCNSVSVIHEIKYSNKGTRSEGRSGYLKINGALIPDCFSRVVADGRVYSFRTKSVMWGNDGYFPVEGASAESVYPPVDKSISDADIARGWSEVTGRYKDVPAGWIFVQWQGGSAAVSPDKIDAMVREMSLNRIPRNSLFNILKD